jgi:hypothetical protein
MKWHPISELPIEGERVLLYKQQHEYIAGIGNYQIPWDGALHHAWLLEMNADGQECERMDVNPTHWMYLSELPKP